MKRLKRQGWALLAGLSLCCAGHAQVIYIDDAGHGRGLHPGRNGGEERSRTTAPRDRAGTSASSRSTR